MINVEFLVLKAGNLAGFIEQFSIFADTPGGVNQLRNLIIQLGIKGQLVKQVPEDGSACSELDNILTIKADLIKQKLFKRTPKLEKIEINVEPYQLPSSWVWTTLATIGQINPRNNVGDEVECSFIPMPSISQIYNGLLLKEARQWKDIKSGFTHLAEGDIALAKITPCFQNSKAAVMRGLHNNFGAGTTELYVFRPITNTILPKYVYLYLKSPKFIEDGILKMTGSAGQKRVSVDYFAGTPFPLPPLEEQKRIVAKVDELMALCDKLESQQQQQANTVLRANTAAINALLNPSTPETSFEQNWQRIAQHFNTLYGCTLPMPKGQGRKKKHLVGLENVRLLRQVIITLAILGKLLPQKYCDESANHLLSKIAKEKKSLTENGLLKKAKVIASLSDSEKKYNLPKNWEWTHLSEIMSIVTDGDHQAPPKTDEGFPFLVIGNLNKGIVDKTNCRFVPNEYFEKLDWTRKPKNKDILYTVTGSYGIPIKVNVSFEFCVQRHVAILKAVKSTPSDYIFLILSSKYALDYATSIATGIAQKTVPLTGLRKMPIAIPPREEQKRIIAKVDQLMTLCDQLEQQLTQSYSDAEKLMQATVKALVA